MAAQRMTKDIRQHIKYEAQRTHKHAYPEPSMEIPGLEHMVYRAFLSIDPFAFSSNALRESERKFWANPNPVKDERVGVVHSSVHQKYGYKRTGDTNIGGACAPIGGTNFLRSITILVPLHMDEDSPFTSPTDYTHYSLEVRMQDYRVKVPQGAPTDLIFSLAQIPNWRLGREIQKAVMACVWKNTAWATEHKRFVTKISDLADATTTIKQFLGAFPAGKQLLPDAVMDAQVNKRRTPQEIAADLGIDPDKLGGVVLASELMKSIEEEKET